MNGRTSMSKRGGNQPYSERSAAGNELKSARNRLKEALARKAGSKPPTHAIARYAAAVAAYYDYRLHNLSEPSVAESYGTARERYDVLFLDRAYAQLSADVWLHDEARRTTAGVVSSPMTDEEALAARAEMAFNREAKQAIVQRWYHRRPKNGWERK